MTVFCHRRKLKNKPHTDTLGPSSCRVNESHVNRQSPAIYGDLSMGDDET